MSVLTAMLMRHEGVKLHPYIDTVGKTTIGVGRNLDDLGLTLDEAEFLLENDIARVTAELRRAYPWYSALDACRMDAVTDMAFNLGLSRFSTFHRFSDLMAQKDYNGAAKEILDSIWAVQVKARAEELAAMIRTGTYQ